MLNQELILTPCLIDVDAPTGNHGDAIGGLEAEITRCHAEAGALHLRLAVLQSKVVVTTGGQADARDLSGNPDLAELLVKQGPDPRVELGNGQELARWLQIKEGLLHDPLPW